MFEVVKQVICLYLALSVTTLACQIVRRSIREGLVTTSKHIPGLMLQAVTAPFKMIVKIITSLITAVVKMMVKVLLAVMQLPLDVAWSTIPGLSSIPKPDVKDLFD